MLDYVVVLGKIEKLQGLTLLIFHTMLNSRRRFYAK